MGVSARYRIAQISSWDLQKVCFRRRGARSTPINNHLRKGPRLAEQRQAGEIPVSDADGPGNGWYKRVGRERVELPKEGWMVEMVPKNERMSRKSLHQCLGKLNEVLVVVVSQRSIE